MSDRDPKDALDAFIAEYLDRLSAGEALDPVEVLESHPDCAEEILEELRAYIDLGQEIGDRPPIGTLGDYELRRTIGRGGMGIVYDAWENSMVRRVALKVLPSSIAADTRTVARFIREAQVAGKLSHPNVVPVFAMGVKEQVPYYAMEFVEGETLARILARWKSGEAEPHPSFGATRDELAFYLNLAKPFADVADGLQHAHSKGIVHRDIKPSNLIRDREGRLRILDFGLARLEGQESLTQTGDFVGTPLYMSPEQAQARRIPIDHRTDIYSLGATMYEALTLQPPFRGRDHQDTLSQIITRDPDPPRKHNQTIPKDFETIVLKCLRKDPRDRYGTAEALGQDLRRFVRGDPIEARGLTGWEKLSQRLWRRRRSLLAAATILLVTLLALSLSAVLIAGAYRAMRQARDARTKELYGSNMRLAMQDWEAGNYLRFLDLLDRHIPQSGEPDLRAWEWYYLDSLRHTPKRISIRVDPRGVQYVAWHPNGSQVASGSADGVTRLWDATSGAFVGELPGDGSAVRAIAYTRDGSKLAAVSQNGTVRGWDVASRQEFFVDPPASEGPAGHELRSIVWSPDGNVLVSGSGRQGIEVRDGATGAIVRKLPGSDTDCVPCMSWSPDGTRLATVVRATGQIVIWSAQTWEEEHRIDTNTPFLYAAVWSPDGSMLATGCTDHWIRILSTQTWEEETRFLAHTGHVFCLEWRREGLASTGQDGVVKVWDSATWKEKKRLLGHTEMVWWLAWSPDGRRIASAGQDGTMHIWDLTSKDLAFADTDARMGAWSPDGRRIAIRSRGDQTIDVLEVSTWSRLAKLEAGDGNGPLVFSPEGRLLATTGIDSVTIWEWARGLRLERLEGLLGGETPCLAWSPEGDLLATAGSDGVVKIWDAASWKAVEELRGHEAAVGTVAWSPDGQKLATTSDDLALRIWDRATWTCVRVLYRAERLGGSLYSTLWHAIAWSPDGRLIAGSASQFSAIRCWQVESGTEIFSVSGHVSGISSIAWSPDGQRLATGGFDRALKIWDVSDLEEPLEIVALGGHDWVVHTLSWHPAGRMLLSGDSVGGLRIWDASAAYEVRER